MANVNYMNPGITDPSMQNYDVQISPLNQLRHREQNRAMALDMYRSQMTLQNLGIEEKRNELADWEANAGLREATRRTSTNALNRADEVAGINQKGLVSSARFQNSDEMLKMANSKYALTQEFETKMQKYQLEAMDLRENMNSMQGIHTVASAMMRAQTDAERQALQPRLEAEIQRTAQWLESQGNIEEAQELLSDPEGSVDNILKTWGQMEDQLIGIENNVKAARDAQAKRSFAKYENQLAIALERAKKKAEKDFKVPNDPDQYAAMLLQDGLRNETDQQFMQVYFKNMFMETMGEAIINTYYDKGRELITQQMREEAAANGTPLPEDWIISPGEYTEYMTDQWIGPLLNRLQWKDNRPKDPGASIPEYLKRPDNSAFNYSTQPRPTPNQQQATQSIAQQPKPSQMDNAGQVDPPLPNYDVYGSNTVPQPSPNMKTIGKTKSGLSLEFDGTSYYINGQRMQTGAVYIINGKKMIYNGGDPRNVKSSFTDVPSWNNGLFDDENPAPLH